MGKQINFYMSKSIQESFIEFLLKNRFAFLDKDASLVKQANSDNITSVYLYKENYGNIIMHGEGAAGIDVIKSPVIQFRKTIIKEERKAILRGRLWIASQYYAEDGTVIKKNDLFLKDYQLLARWIKKNIPLQKIEKGKHNVNEYASDELKDLQDKGFILTL